MRLPKFTEERFLAEKLKTPEAIEEFEKISLGEQLKKLRLRANIKQSELAKALKTTQSAIARIENGKQNLTLRTLIHLSVLLGKKLIIRFQ